jgi:hypothetical protein
MRRSVILLSLASSLGAQDPTGTNLHLDLSTDLGSDPTAKVRLVPSGCWAGLMLSATARATPPMPSRRQRVAEATVEVWDIAYHETRSQETFRLFKENLLLSIRAMWRFAPASHGQIDAAIRGGDGKGGSTDMAMVRSLVQRFNQLPPEGSPVK